MILYIYYDYMKGVYIFCNLCVFDCFLTVYIKYIFIFHILYIDIRSYHGGNTRSHPNSAVKHHWACLVLRWGTTREP